MTEKNGVERSTATEVLRRLLDECGVEHYDGTETTLWLKDGIGYRASADEGLNGYIHLHLWCTTPEQAIAATLGPAVRHPKPHEQWTTVLLPEIAWSWDDSWPDYLSVAHDTHGEWRTYVPEATLGSCNCPNNCTNGERTETCADGGTVSETYIRPTEEGSICPIPRASVIFEGQKLTFDEEDSARFTEIVKRHLRKLAGLEVEQ